MPFQALGPLLPTLAGLPHGDDPLPSLPSARLASFGDDIVTPTGRLSVRAVVRGTPERLSVDFSDSDPPRDGFGLTLDDARLACILALSTALDVQPDRRWLERLQVQTLAGSWVGDATPDDPARRAMGLARAFDAVLGALAGSWPSRVASGSTTVGAMVELRCGDAVLCEAIAGGEGATPSRDGRAGWSSPVLAPVSAPGFTPWLAVTERTRSRSGGGGARRGGDGVQRQYQVAQDVVATVALDRIRNPPHGIDRAGPPLPAYAELVEPDGTRVAVQPWVATPMSAGSTLDIATAGGAGHGFGGYGEIEFDPSDWFGSSSDTH